MKTLAMTQAERIASLEMEVAYLRNDHRALALKVEAQMSSIDTKLDALISLRDKGAGAFWLGTTLFGASMIGFASLVMSWFK